MAEVTVRSIRDLMVVVVDMVVLAARRSQRNSSCIVSASAPLVGVDYPLPDFSPNFHIFA